MDWLKVDFHTHTAEDPEDNVPYAAHDLIDRAVDLGYDALAITNHNAVTHSADLAGYAVDRGLVLIPGTELTLSRRHVQVLSLEPRAFDAAWSLEDLPRVRRPDDLVIAPHPFYRAVKSLHDALEAIAPLVDAVEFSGYFSPRLDMNKKAVIAARRLGKPLVGSSDCHNLWQFGLTWTLVKAEKNVPSIMAAVKAGRVEVRAKPLSLLAMARVAANFMLTDRLKLPFRF
ncbi:MAG: PHP domain-containing protein [Candidatus Aminicenantes bacterium]|nr:PHP domain-containing protein [Candidatus Aminicenantes bacterium]